MAWVGLVVGQFHAMARHNTVDGKEDLEMLDHARLVRPGRDLFKPLLDWANPDAVYLTYGKIWFPVFAAFTACAFVLYRRRRPGRLREVRLAVRARRLRLGDASRCWSPTGPSGPTRPRCSTSPSCSWTSPGCCSMVGSTVLGITLLRRGFRPRVTAWLLALTLPLSVVIRMFTSMGSGALPVMFAFGIAGHRLARSSDPAEHRRRALPSRPAHSA